jgi:hypothetical protein
MIFLNKEFFLTYSAPSWNQIALVENKNQVFVTLFFFYIRFDLFASGTLGVSRVQDLDHNVR